jgi:TonB family protein
MTLMNSPEHKKFDLHYKGENRHLGAGLFCILLLIHVLFIVLSGFFLVKTVKDPELKKELTLAFEQVFSPPPPKASPQAALPEKIELPAELVPEIVEEAEDVPFDDTPALDAFDTENFTHAGSEYGEPGESVDVPAVPAVRRMSEAEYLAMIMKRLQENRVYPLSMRKRGIQGDMAVNFTIHSDGSVGAIEPGDPRAHPFLKQAALETIKAAGPFPVWEGISGDYSMKVTIRYRLEEEEGL